MKELWQRLKQRKLVQWAVAYVAAAFALLQGIDIVAQQFGWPDTLQRGITLAMVLGFFVALVLAWYHGERGEQKVSTTEILIVALLLAIGGGLMWRHAQVSPEPGVASAARAGADAGTPASDPEVSSKSIAVLPFVNMSADPEQEYFSDGIAEELLNRLAQIPDLKVAARTSAFQFKGKNQDIGEIGRKLKVAHVLEGSVRKGGNTLRITAQLIDSRTGYHMWSETFDRDASDVFKVQDEIAGAIANALQAQLGEAATAAKPARAIDPQAYDQYLQGRAFLAVRRGGLDKAIQAFDRAIAIDPGFSAAYSGRAFAITLRPQWSLARPTDAVLVKASQSADLALKLDHDNAEAYMVRGMIASFRRDPVTARADLEHARALAPGNIDVLNMIGDFHLFAGEVEAAERDKRKAMELDPLAFVHPLNLSDALAVQGRYAEAITAAERAAALGAKEYAYARIVFARAMGGQPQQGEKDLQEFCAIETADPGACQLSRFYALLAQRQSQQARLLLETIARAAAETDSLGTALTPSSIASSYELLKDFDKATAWQKIAIDKHDWYPTNAALLTRGGAKLPEEISTDPEWLAVWHDPRIKAVMDDYRRNVLAWRAERKTR